MTYGGAGSALPILILLILNFVIFFAWFLKGAGHWQAKLLVTSIALVLFSALVALSASVTEPPVLRDAIQAVTLVFPIISVVVPAIANRVWSNEHT